MECAARIKRIRQQQGLTQEALGQRIGVPTSSISKFENGIYRLHLVILAKIADGLGVPMLSLLEEEKTVQKAPEDCRNS